MDLEFASGGYFLQKKTKPEASKEFQVSRTF
jgi:hypothetical protein